MQAPVLQTSNWYVQRAMVKAFLYHIKSIFRCDFRWTLVVDWQTISERQCVHILDSNKICMLHLVFLTIFRTFAVPHKIWNDQPSDTKCCNKVQHEQIQKKWLHKRDVWWSETNWNKWILRSERRKTIMAVRLVRWSFMMHLKIKKRFTTCLPDFGCSEMQKRINFNFKFTNKKLNMESENGRISIWFNPLRELRYDLWII